MADVTDATFQTAVLDRSAEVPVVVDLWAPWCGPCKTLGPLLESEIAATGGRVELAKVNVDDNPGVAQMFQVQGIPAVYALKDGQVVDGFVGAQGQQVVQDFITKLLPTEEESEVDALVEAGDPESLVRALELEPDNERAIVGMAEHLVAAGETDDALALLARIPETADTRRVAALARTGGAPTDGEVADKLDALLPKVKTDDAARQEYIDLLEVMGADDPRTADYRRKLSSVLY